jgi:hypothetical protein
MTVIYAAPFILLSLIAFVCSLAIPRMRPYAFRALVAPIAFGFCSIMAMVLILAISHGLNLQFANAPFTGLRRLFEGVVIYVFPGLVGAWIAIQVLITIENRVLKTQGKRALAIETVIALLVFCPIFIVCTSVLLNMFSSREEWWPAFLAVSCIAALVAAALTYLLIRMFWRRRPQNDTGS